MGRALEAIVATKARVIERALELGEGLIESSA
jgi:hypothetical protein